MKLTTRTDVNYGAGGGIYSHPLSVGPPFAFQLTGTGTLGATAGIGNGDSESWSFLVLIPAIPDIWNSR